jgi:hypothetical protein
MPWQWGKREHPQNSIPIISPLVALRFTIGAPHFGHIGDSGAALMTAIGRSASDAVPGSEGESSEISILGSAVESILRYFLK